MPENIPLDDVSPLTFRSLARFLKTLIDTEVTSGKYYTPNMDCRIEIQRFFPSGKSDAALARYLNKLVELKFLSINCGPSGLKTVGYCITTKAVTLVEAELNPPAPFIPAVTPQPLKDLTKVYGKVKKPEKKQKQPMRKPVQVPLAVDQAKEVPDPRITDALAILGTINGKLEKLRKEIDQKEQARVIIKLRGGHAATDQIMAGLRIREKILLRLVNEENERLKRIKSAKS